MNKPIAILLIILSVYLGYTGITKLNNSGESVEVVGVELSAQDNQKKTTSFILIALALASLAGGVSALKKS
ncbi:MAG: hypothetical protein HKO66_09760 [Saprospiraceae bacterium]|nr:hypothetical protein [Bacteroidia bacterium]NNE14602.1 hypothetical protein [Saprospiraceae bacterium]NNL92505.1 hypothetical protein [Saprospiraceae bacterium]